MVYAKAPLGGPAQVLEYLSRYTHRRAISNERIRTMTPKEVVFSVRANDRGGKRLERLEGVEFVRRFALHVLLSGLKRIRHYGVLACSCKAAQLTAPRQCLQMPQSNVRAVECAHDFMARLARIDVHLYPCCKAGRMRVRQVLLGSLRLPALCANVLLQRQGPHEARSCKTALHRHHIGQHIAIVLGQALGGWRTGASNRALHGLFGRHGRL